MGEWGRHSGERGLQELLTIKDTWTKSMVRVEMGDRGGFSGVGWRDGEKRHTTVIK